MTLETLAPVRDLTLAEAVNETLRDEMRRDPAIVLIGEDVAEIGGIYGTSRGLHEEFGDRRVVEAPLAEGSVIGTAIGMALHGLRPVVELQFADFAWNGFDQVVSELAKIRYRSGGQYTCPLVLRIPCGAGVSGGIYQSQSPEAHYCHTPGLVVVTPANPADGAGLLRAALRADDPVIVLEPKRLYGGPAAAVASDGAPVELGSARVARPGEDVSVFAYGALVDTALAAAELAAESEISVEVVDLRTLVPLDIATVLGSAVKTGRAVVLSEAPKTCGYAAELSATLAERAFFHLDAPIERLAGFDTPVPYAHENAYLPDARRVADAIERVANH